MLNRLALRLITVRALRGRTLAGEHVLDSEGAALDDIASERPQPFLIVYTDDGRFRGAGRDMLVMSGDSRVDVGFQHLVIEIALTQRMTVEGGGEEAIQPQTDAAMELYLDLIERQIVTALMDPRPEAQWADLWRSLVKEISDRDCQRGASQRDGVRFAGRQIRLSVQLPKDPPPGEPLGPTWTKFLVLARADADLVRVVPLIEGALAGTGLTDWQMAQEIFGLSSAEAKAMLYASPTVAGAKPDMAP